MVTQHNISLATPCSCGRCDILKKFYSAKIASLAQDFIKRNPIKKPHIPPVPRKLENCIILGSLFGSYHIAQNFADINCCEFMHSTAKIISAKIKVFCYILLRHAPKSTKLNAHEMPIFQLSVKYRAAKILGCTVQPFPFHPFLPC